MKKVDVNNLDDLRSDMKKIEPVKLAPQSVYQEAIEVPKK